MPIGTTVHHITIGKGEKIKPGVTREFTDKEWDDLFPRGAVREPSEAEEQIFNGLAKKAPAKKTPAKKTPAKKPAPKADEPKTDQDPEVTDDDGMLD